MTEPIIKISDKAVNRIKEIMSKAENTAIGVRVGVKSGGCAGLSYIMEYAKDKKPNEEIIEDRSRTKCGITFAFSVNISNQKAPPK